ncbi:Hypothetical predicted protein [Paramuricea clavata]|uniref:Uncharacterized protein n=1 Tax=Paramuricea clavata TaxID=317549 RepID=A0A6S7FQZ8_PARCT|nr:Hypothetical predicted protein [Paramuricea clavata]
MQWTKPPPGKGKPLPGIKKPLPDSSPLPNKIIWPAKAETTNFQFAKPTPEAIGRPGNIGHSEEQLLNSFNIMADNFIARHKNECPCYVILGTKIYPCYNSRDQTGCARNYVNVKQDFQKECPSTKFYLIYGRAGTPAVQAVLTGNGITTFSYP